MERWLADIVAAELSQLTSKERNQNLTITSTMLSANEIKSLEDYINNIVKEDVKVSEEFISHEEAMKRFDMSRLPEDASQTLRVIKIGDYDQCLCAGSHVEHTGEIGEFRNHKQSLSRRRAKARIQTYLAGGLRLNLTPFPAMIFAGWRAKRAPQKRQQEAL